MAPDAGHFIAPRPIRTFRPSFETVASSGALDRLETDACSMTLCASFDSIAA